MENKFIDKPKKTAKKINPVVEERKGIIIKKGNKFYSVGIKEFITDTVGVDEIKFEINPGKTIESDFTCPYCKNIDYDVLEKSEGEIYCGNCGSTVNLSYDDGNFIAEPVFPSSIIIVK